MPSQIDIYLARKRLGLTQTELAKLLGVCRKTIFNWETGAHRIKGKHLLFMSEILSWEKDMRKCKELEMELEDTT